MEKTFVTVHLLDAAFRMDRPYSYFLPPELRAEVRKCTLLVVPFGRGNKLVSAVATDFSDSCEYANVKAVASVLAYPFDIPEEFADLCRFMKERFLCTFGQAFRAILPPGIQLKTEVFYRYLGVLSPENAEKRLLQLVSLVREQGELTQQAATEAFGEEAAGLLRSLCEKGVLERKTRVPSRINEKKVTCLRLQGSLEEITALLEGDTLTERQKSLLEMLMHYPRATLRELCEIGGYSPSVISALVRKGLVVREEVRIHRETVGKADTETAVRNTAEVVLSEEQQQATDTLCALADQPTARAALLYGVTGSGKTKVIIRTVRHVLSKGQTAIILLPEIGLTAQATEIYRREFGSSMAVIHSMLSVGERVDTFRAMREGRIRVVLGTRSAVFAPLDGLGIIVIDEEQESTYKSELSPKYHARDVARFRCASRNALLLLASATPSVESFYKAQSGAYTLVCLRKRYGGAVLPQVEIEDLRNDNGAFPDKLIGTRLEKELLEAKKNDRQSILFVHRRGYQSHVSCHSCGTVLTCPQCSVSLTLHLYDSARQGNGRLVCHYCGYERSMPKVCDVCGKAAVLAGGFGTQKLQEELTERMPDLQCLRMDADTTSEKDSHERILDAFGERQADVLLGTQMVSKGLDFPAVSLVGMISVDSLLYQNDFRAGERTFSLITQLVGRAGRSKSKGLAILQTYNPDNEILRLAAAQDYDAFYRSEIVLRKSVTFPPFCSVLVFTVSSQEEAQCTQAAAAFATLLAQMRREEGNDRLPMQVFGPYPSGIYKIGGRFRLKIIVKYSDTAASRAFFAAVYGFATELCPKTVRLEADANPSLI